MKIHLGTTLILHTLSSFNDFLTSLFQLKCLGVQARVQILLASGYLTLYSIDIKKNFKGAILTLHLAAIHSPPHYQPSVLHLKKHSIGCFGCL